MYNGEVVSSHNHGNVMTTRDDAKGADALAERFAAEFNIPTEIYPADWKRYGRAAGPKRNDTIAKACDGCIAFTIGPSKGTMDAIKKCRAKNKPVIHIAVE